MQFWKNVDSYVDQYLIPVENMATFWFLQTQRVITFEEVKNYAK
jgi:hypothetical protein